MRIVVRNLAVGAVFVVALLGITGCPSNGASSTSGTPDGNSKGAKKDDGYPPPASKMETPVKLAE